MVVLLFFPFGLFLHAYARVYKRLPEVERTYHPELGTVILDVKGRTISELFHERRSYVILGDIPRPVVLAFLAAEDRNFYIHRGYDFFAMLRALAADLISGKIEQGGSTITQQCAKQLYAGSRRSLSRKMEELFFALELERRLSKDDILEIYLNHIYFGHGVYGVKAASSFYFGRDISTLGAIEGSILASISPAPARYSPLADPAVTFSRSRSILFRMTSAGWADREVMADSFENFWQSYLLDNRLRSPDEKATIRSGDRAPHLTEYIRRQLLARFGENVLYREGLTVYTTIDIDMQEKAEELLRAALEVQRPISAHANSAVLRTLDEYAVSDTVKNRKEAAQAMTNIRSGVLDSLILMGDLAGSSAVVPAERYASRYSDLESSSRTEGAFLAMDISDGGIRAMVGGGEFAADNQLNRAISARRQPGSAFKTFVYGAALEAEKITPATAFLDMPMVYMEKDRVWTPSNYDKKFRGRVLARKAFASSLNVVSVQIYEMTGGGRIAKFASRLTGARLSGFTLDPTLSLGSSSMTLWEMVKGYGVIACEGKSVDPHVIIRITDRSGKVVDEYRAPEEKRVMSKPVALLMRDFLQDVVNRGTAAGAVRQNAGLTVQAAGKTGTTSDFRDAWFVGFTPDLVAGVWMGCDDPIFTLGENKTGSVCAAPVWARFMKETEHRNDKFSSISGSDGIFRREICPHSGLLPGKTCEAVREYFLYGTVPDETCNGIHEKMESISDLENRRENKP